jgi:hypothetical protein
MRKLAQVFAIILMLVGALAFFERPAYGYTDPGTGLLAIQAAGSALVAAGWVLRRKLSSLFHRGSSTKREVDGNSSSDSAKDSSPR